MYYNEMVNVKSSFEILYNANLEDDVTHEGKTKALEDLLIKQEKNGDKLFITMEQGSGVASSNIQVILNPKLKYKARKWLVEVYPEVIFNYQSSNEISVNSQEFQTSMRYNEELKRFLTPVLQKQEVTKVKKFGKRMKSYAQVLGINCIPQQ